MAELKEGEAIDNPTLLEEFIHSLQYIADNYPDDVVEAFVSVAGADGSRQFLILREDSYERLMDDPGRKAKQSMKIAQKNWLKNHDCNDEIARRREQGIS